MSAFRRVAALVLALVPVGSGSAGAMRATLQSVQSDPFYAAWAAALDATTPPGAGCATDDGRFAEELQKHERRLELLASLARRGIEPAAAPAGTGPWPWDAVPGARLAVVDTGDVAVLFDDGHAVYRNRYGLPEVDPFFAARLFYDGHHDEYDFFALYTNFYTQLGGGSFLAYHLAAANDVTGLGYVHVLGNELFNDARRYTHKPAPGRLQSFVHMNNLNDYPDDPAAIYYRRDTALSLLGHEFGHRWLARLRLEYPGVGPSLVLLGRQRSHWSFWFNSGGSPVEGNAWGFDGARFGTLDVPYGYSPLDLYLMGMLAPVEVPPEALWYVADPHDPEPPYDDRGNLWAYLSPPTPGVTCAGTRTDFTVDDVALTNGYRLPAYPDARRDFRAAFALLVRGADLPSAAELDKLARIQSAFQDWFRDQTQGRGSLDVGLRRVPDRIVFEHRSHGDFEDPTRPIPIAARVTLEPWTLHVPLADVRLELVWSVDGGPFVETPMATTTPGEFTAEIPPQAQGSTLRYWLRGTSSVPGHEHRLPASAPDSAITFRIRPDNGAPTLQHVRLRRWSRLAEPPLLRALARDAHAVADVRLEVRVAGGSLVTMPLQPQGTSDVWEVRPVLPGRIGDVVEYRIVARDVSATPHTTAAPATGFYSLPLERSLYEDAESEEPAWTHYSLAFERPDEWHREIVNPIAGLRSWKVGPQLNTVPGSIASRQDAVLESPAVQVFPGGVLKFWHRYAFLLDEFTPRYEAIDGGIVLWQDVNRPNGPLGGYYLLEPDSGYTHTVGFASDSPLVGLPVFAGYQPFARQETFTFPPWVVNHTVRFRLRVATSSPQPTRASLDGWVVDDLEIDPGPPPTPIVLAAFDAARTSGGVRLTWSHTGSAPADPVFRILRAPLPSPGEEPIFESIANLPASPTRTDWEFLDAAPPEDIALVYRLILSAGGADLASRDVIVPGLQRFALQQPVPNPFNPTTRLAFALPQRGRTLLAVYDVHGRHVRTLVDATLDAGPHAATWDGRDARGRDAASGVYLARLQSTGRELVRRLVLVR